MKKRNYLYTIIACGLSLFLYDSALSQNKPNSAIKRKVATPAALPVVDPVTKINYIRTWEPQMPTGDTAAVISNVRTTAEVKEVTQYFDGLGRLIQSVSKKQSTSGKDLVSPVVYDEWNREQYKYLPYVPQSGNTNDGKYKTDPYTGQRAFYQDTLLNPASNGESIYYSQTDFDGSPLNIPQAAYAPGNSWAKTGGGHSVVTENLYNTVSDSVRIWKQATEGALPISSGTYAAGELTKTVITSESGQKSIEYKDRNGRVILKKSQAQSSIGTAHMGWFCTYYVYDDWSNLCFVIPPFAVEGAIQNWNLSNVAAGLCFQYRYDNRNRAIIKKIPGSDSTELVYDTRDRVVFTRDGNMKADGNWLVTFYDELNRPVKTALYKSAATRQSLQDQMNAIVSATGSTSYTFPGESDLVIAVYDNRSKYEATNSITFVSGFEAGGTMEASINPILNNGATTILVNNPLPNLPDNLLTPLKFFYYDNYSFNGAQSIGYADSLKLNAGNNPYKEAFAITGNAKGLLTGSKVRIIGTDQWLLTTNYYSDKGRVLQTIKDNNGGGKDILTNQYDFSGKLLSSYLRHNNPRSGTIPQLTELTSLAYDGLGRMVAIKKKYNDQDSLERTIVVNEYDEMSKLKAERLGIKGTSSPLERISFEYNIRDWVKSINKRYLNGLSDTAHFGQELNYDYGFTDSLFNGNISGIRWKGWNDPRPRAYGYNYDLGSRLTHAEFSQQNATNSAWTKDLIDFTVDWISYDANGNIRKMSQKGLDGTTSKSIDQLNYSYQAYSNKLSAVYDTSAVSSSLGDFKNGTNSGDDYAYDPNGNLTKDLNKGITSITYNHLNLPSVIQTTKGTIAYQYDADGTKQKKIVTDLTGTTAKVTTTTYIGGMVYNNDSLELISHDKGRVRTVIQTGKPVGYVYDYFVKDHLGNVRLVLTEQSDFKVYAATMETANAAVETALFSNIDETRSVAPAGYPTTSTTTENKSVAKLVNTSGAKKIGPSLVLRVMAGDTIQIGGKAFYKSTGPVEKTSDQSIPENIVADLISTFSGGSKQASGHGAEELASNTPFNSNFYNNDLKKLKEKDGAPDPSRPKAYLNYILFDDQFKMVDENSGVKQVKNEPDELQLLNSDQMLVKQSGFLYVYTSNESNQEIFFDDIIVTQATGPVLEETHYYPFGLTMAGISANALKGTNYSKNRKEFNGIEHAIDLELNQYDAFYRTLDPQIGRWRQIDPKPNDAVSPYAAMDNNPIRYSDFLGDTTIAGAGFWRNAWEGIKDGGRSTAAWVKSLGTVEGIGKTLDGMAAMSPFNVDEGSVGARTQMIDNTVNYVADIPNKSKDQIGHDVGFGLEKIGEAAIVSKGLGLIKNGGVLLTEGTIGAEVVPKGPLTVNEATLSKALEGSTMKTTQGSISLPTVERYVRRLESGSASPPIKVADGIIVDGNHRYVAGRLFGVEPPVTPGTISPSQVPYARPIQSIKFDPYDWGNK